MILTLFSLLIPAFSLVYSPPPLSLRLHPVHNALLPPSVLHQMLYLILWNNFLACGEEILLLCTTLDEALRIPSFGLYLSPVKFSAQGHSTSELLRTL